MWYNKTIMALWFLLALTLAGCGHNDDDPVDPPPTTGSATITPGEGGVVEGPDGVQLTVPAGTVEAPVTFRIASDSTGAPELLGLNAVSPIYAITPHGQLFDGSARVSIPLTAAQQLPTGATPLLLKSELGGKWRVLKNISIDPTKLAADIDGLSFYVLGSCTSTDNTWTIGALDCPGVDHQLKLALYDQNNVPVSSSDFENLVPWEVNETPQTLRFNAFWKRPNGTGRTDQLSVVGSPGGFNSTGFRSTWTNEVVNVDPSFGSYGKFFSVTIDPARVHGANLPNGALLRVKAYASYETTAFRAGVGNVPVSFIFEASFPIRVRYTSPLPVIAQQPANVGVAPGQPASFAVQASITPSATLSYQWSRRANPASAFAPIAGATASSYTLGAAQLSDDGAQFQVQVCSSTTSCITSNTATLTVVQNPLAPTFTLQPLHISVVAGQTASFSVTATGSPLPGIDWESAPGTDPTNFTRVGAARCGRTNPPASGTSTSSTCTVGPTTLSDHHRLYRAVATNAAAPAGVPSTPAALLVTAAPTAPLITAHPVAQKTIVNGAATFRIVADGTAPLSYKWQVNGTDLSGPGPFTTGACTGTATFSVNNVTLSNLSAGCNGATITVTVSNGLNPDATSNPATLTVTTPTLGLSLLAGALGGPGTIDGTRSDARVGFNPGSGIAVDANGTAYFTDPIANRVRKVTATGIVTTISGALRAPSGVVVDSAGNAYVAERGNNRILRFTPAGTQSVFLGRTPSEQMSLTQLPTYLAIDASDNIYFVHFNGVNQVLRRVTPSLAITDLYVFGSDEYIGAIAAAADGSAVYAAHGHAIVRIAGGVINVLAGSAIDEGNQDGAGNNARFKGISGIARAANGDLYVTDSNNQSVRRVTAAGEVTTVSGTPVYPANPVDGIGAAGRYGYPTAIGGAPNGDLLIGDGSTMRRLTPGFALTTFVGQHLVTGTADGSGNLARFSQNLSVALDDAGNAYVTDYGITNSGRIRKVTPAGDVTTLTSSPGRWYSFIARDSANGGFIVATANAVWRMTTSGTTTLLAGAPSLYDYVDAPVGADAHFGAIRGLAVDSAGNAYVAESVNQNATIRRITPAGEVSTWAGAKDALPEMLDGVGNAARFRSVGSLAFDASGNLIVADGGALRRITPQRNVTTWVTSGSSLGASHSLALEPSGSLLAVGDAVLQRISSAGVVITLLGEQGVRGVRLGPSPQLNLVGGMAVRPNGQIVLTSEAAVLELTLP